jgi:hypothetical protein
MLHVGRLLASAHSLNSAWYSAPHRAAVVHVHAQRLQALWPRMRSGLRHLAQQHAQAPAIAPTHRVVEKRAFAGQDGRARPQRRVTGHHGANRGSSQTAERSIAAAQRRPQLLGLTSYAQWIKVMTALSTTERPRVHLAALEAFLRLPATPPPGKAALSQLKKTLLLCQSLVRTQDITYSSRLMSAMGRVACHRDGKAVIQQLTREDSTLDVFDFVKGAEQHTRSPRVSLGLLTGGIRLLQLHWCAFLAMNRRCPFANVNVSCPSPNTKSRQVQQCACWRWQQGCTCRCAGTEVCLHVDGMAAWPSHEIVYYLMAFCRARPGQKALESSLQHVLQTSRTWLSGWSAHEAVVASSSLATHLDVARRFEPSLAASMQQMIVQLGTHCQDQMDAFSDDVRLGRCCTG